MPTNITGPKQAIPPSLISSESISGNTNTPTLGSAITLRLRAGYEMIAQSLPTLSFSKSSSRGEELKAQFYQRIKQDYGEGVATKVFADFKDARKLSHGDVSYIKGMAIMAETIARLDTHFINKPQVSSFMQTNINDIPRYLNQSMKVYEAASESSDPSKSAHSAEATEALGNLAHMQATYKGKPILDMMNSMSNLTQLYKRLSQITDSKSQLPKKTDLEVLDQHIKELGPIYGLPAMGVRIEGGMIAIAANGGFQLGMRLNMLTDMLKKTINSLATETNSEKIRAKLEGPKGEIAKIQDYTKSFEAMGKMFQDPKFLKDLSPAVQSLTRNMGLEYASLATAMNDPESPTQGLIALSNLAYYDFAAAAVAAKPAPPSTPPTP
jgi:hypothetical protein